MGRYTLGIDLGTLNSCVAVVRDGRAVVLGEDSRKTMPSAVSFAEGRELVGDPARRAAVVDPANTLVATKRLLGHPFDSPEVSAARERMLYEIVPSPLGSVVLRAGGQELTPVQVAARVLQALRERAARELGEPVERAVISVPAHFNEVQRRATKLAAEYAGLEVVRLVNEPTAAAFAYGYKKGENFTLAVFDLGGGTFDVTIMRAEGDTFDVLATDGDAYLGGEDFDNAVADWLADEFQRSYGEDPRQNENARLRLKEAAERAKCDLTELDQTEITLPYLMAISGSTSTNFERTLTRQKLEELTDAVVARTLDLCGRCMASAQIQRGELDTVLLVGGQTRMPAVREAVRQFFGLEPKRDTNPDEVVAIGAALYAYSLSADRLQSEAQDAAGESYEVALRQTYRARKVVERLGELRSEGVTGKELSQKISEHLAAIEAELPAVRGDPDVDLPAALRDLKEEMYDLQRKVDADRANLPTTTDLPGETPGVTGSAEAPPQGPAPAEEPRRSKRKIWGRKKKAASPSPAPAPPPAAGGTPRPEAKRGGPAPSPSRPDLEAFEAVSDWLSRASEASKEAETQLEEASEHAQARRVKLRDVTSHALGIGSAGDLLSILIQKNAKVPAEVRRTFTTHQDEQPEVEIRVFQGENRQATRNELLGQFLLAGIEAAPRLEPKIEVSFHLDEDGILKVSARDQRTGVAQEITVEEPLGLRQVKAGEGGAGSG